MPDQQLVDLFNREQKYLKEKEEKNPELFEKDLQLESEQILKKVGINFPFPQRPIGYIKYHPFDFIVEEIQQDNSISTIDFEKIKKQKLNEQDPTIYADLVKVNLSTIDAVNQLAESLNIEEKNIGTAGIKDQNALTGQRISLRKTSLEKVFNIKPKNFFLKNLQTGKGAIQTGSLKGNRFTIFIRTENQISQTELEDQLKKIKEKGFLNFYWLQRFGNRLLSHYWGLLLFRGEYEKLLESYFGDEGARDIEFYRQIRRRAAKLFGRWDELRDLFSKLPYTLRYELKMLDHLKNNPNDYIGALNQIPEQVKLWIYAYSSYLFNSLLSFYANSDNKIPAKLPLVLSQKNEDRQPYSAFLKADQVPFDFEKNLRPFPYVRLMPRTVEAKFQPAIHAVKSLKEGSLISFNLEKGSYATTFLAHIFTLTGGLPVPEWIDPQKYDFKKLLGLGSIKETYERFEKFIVEKEEVV